MDGKSWLPVEIAAALDQGTTVITANQRAARTLRRNFDRRNRELGLHSWQPPAIMAWETWIGSLWHQLLLEGRATQMVLNRSQEHVVWRTVLEADQELATLRTVDSLAEMASETWGLVCSYDGRSQLHGAFAGSSDTRSFQRWAQMFERLCRSENFVSGAQLPEILRGFVDRVSLPETGLLLVGFDAMTAAQIRLLDAMRAAGIEATELQPSVAGELHLLASAPDEEEELYAAARWLRTLLENQPETRVAVVVPGLEAERAEIDRVFREILAPELEDIHADTESAPYEFSVGRPLGETPMVAAAMELLRWAAGPLSLERIGVLLLSPYFAEAKQERGTRAEFDAFELRRMKILQPELTLPAFLQAFTRARRRAGMPLLYATLRRLENVARRLEGMEQRSHAEWAERMRELLQAADWGSGETETGLEFQTRRKWESALDELATLDFDGELVEYSQALSNLERITRQTIFAPESREAPVQIMGPLEAAGSTFDALWFLRSGESSWPMETADNPLLPWPMQRNLEMPGTDPERDAEHARRMTRRIANSAARVVFSYAKESGEGRQRPSPVLANLQLEEIDSWRLTGPAEPHPVVALEEIEDLAQVRALPDQVIQGGARVLELQAACGFRAFAEHRLRAAELESVEPGMDARQLGTIVHKVLEIFWNQTRTQQELRSMTEEEREDALDWSITQALKRAEESSTTSWDAAYVEMQHERMRRLLRGWLELEMERPLPFEVSLSEKKFEDVRVGPLRLNVRMDRVDLVDGGEVLIDYKTGLASPNDWLTGRPDAPQLPLYAILSSADKLQGVAFALVRAGEGRAWKGYAATDGVLPRSTRLKEAPTLAAQVDRWRQVLTALAEEFYRGDARVRPKKYPATCAHCGQRLLCRLDSTALVHLDEEEPGDTAEAGRG